MQEILELKQHCLAVASKKKYGEIVCVWITYFESPWVFMIWIETDFQLFPPFVSHFTSPLRTPCISVHTCLYFFTHSFIVVISHNHQSWSYQSSSTAEVLLCSRRLPPLVKPEYLQGSLPSGGTSLQTGASQRDMHSSSTTAVTDGLYIKLKGGFEIQFGVNYAYLAHFPLSNLLLDHLKEAQAAHNRIAKCCHTTWQILINLDDISIVSIKQQGYQAHSLRSTDFYRAVAPTPAGPVFCST